LLARHHAAPGPTLLLTKVSGPWLVRVRPLAWCSPPRIPTALLKGTHGTQERPRLFPQRARLAGEAPRREDLRRPDRALRDDPGATARHAVHAWSRGRHRPRRHHLRDTRRAGGVPPQRRPPHNRR